MWGLTFELRLSEGLGVTAYAVLRRMMTLGAPALFASVSAQYAKPAARNILVVPGDALTREPFFLIG